MRLAFAFSILLILGCAASRQPVAIAGTAEWEPDARQVSVPRYVLWAAGRFAWDQAAGTLEFVPSRTSHAFFNVWTLLNPPKCTNCISIKVTDHFPQQKLLTAKVDLRNPTGLTGYFVRALVHAPAGSGIELLQPDGWWHMASQPEEEDPIPFMAYVTDNEHAFKPGETHSAKFMFHYESLSGFSQCSYAVVVRYPKDPGEYVVYDPHVYGCLTKSGGFLANRVTMVSTCTPPPVTLQKRVVYAGESPGPWTEMRNEFDSTYIGWTLGHPTTSDSAVLWMRALMDGADGNYLAQKVDLNVSDITPEPSREFPPVGDAPSVFVDQLSTQMTPQQMEFMATHAVGSQKLVKTLADAMRAYNPNFIVLQYHLAFGAGDLLNIHGNDWVSNWDFENAQEDFFEHRSWSTQPNQRVLQQDWNWYLTNPTSEWALYFIWNTLERMQPLGDQFDGVFADSASQPWNTDPEKWWEGSDDPHDMFTYWTPKTQSFFDTVAFAYHTLPVYYYLIPNAGSYVTTISDITYYQCDGVMIEGFSHWGAGSYFDEVDWVLQMNRIRDLATKDKIILCQTGVDVDNTVDRLFVLGSYMLIKDNYTYLNMLGPWGLEPQWWPEYSWNPGPAVEDWTTIDELQDAGGCYVRHFQNGIVIVNPSDETRYYTTTKPYSHTLYGEGGLLPEDGVPTGVATGPIVEAGVQELPPHSCWLGVG